MRKVWCLMLLVLFLAGCGAEETFETVADEQVFVQTQPRTVRVTLPEETVLPVMQTDTGRLYICRDFEVAVQTLAGGDLDATIRSLCGFGREDVTLVETVAEGFTRYDFVWTSAGETGGQAGRAAILSDGTYHYCVSAMAPEEAGDQYREIWQGMFETITLD